VTAVIFRGFVLLARCATIIFYPETGAAALLALQIFRTSIADGGGPWIPLQPPQGFGN